MVAGKYAQEPRTQRQQAVLKLTQTFAVPHEISLVYVFAFLWPVLYEVTLARCDLPSSALSTELPARLFEIFTVPFE